MLNMLKISLTAQNANLFPCFIKMTHGLYNGCFWCVDYNTDKVLIAKAKVNHT